ncbi:MAG: bifunctional indole-3-glycerol-phosphate synthase TrpC/phosphoribosylanthranilate isomerase TrpF [Ewingella americana]|jgi:indole-3-glycerol phosphate synthase/phosphoribosylanthranilate isomerase|uniref:bifunctional indole-3-glycerol-phosphate synthase TrpC/phosphoribosylanthranilate isomerase TrpF n=1 Tax=Ewingella americana TaxID=41202 RepID=UPI000C2FDC2F|nr:bifunctional indole-3-glycerol-phosphate synthase TrpC/phosphoribosylanthranilate isomerase TrpF [Ewingella americana]MCI1679154.1 bifunctional indole-3-glycerol-phosphate synthase TrpC/phosphoribosylanthranilate isomerase TrpF [Ewingella americana]MCI1852202.1 bifunctional indole-3-glycerol-phosphate synthase TrpC/phosphoribosylanthranilate isomerase TrpF [Ewingella americana]MCI1862604.1 bifunctional indole-3-glycerol-phosphate synthase TrpC/phosphoribosylanthranilate isomerase TrpF [Ewinge
MQKETVLNKIVADKAIWVAARKEQQPLASFQNEIKPSERNFYDALQGARTAFILECKKASPSKGTIRENFDPVEIAGVYKDHASAISVLTDEKYFQGSFDFLPLVSNAVTQPVLCKDFIIDPYQIYLARYYQADAILLMLSVLSDEQYVQLSAVAHSLKLGILTEASNEEELDRAVQLKARVVGINNRDLRDLSIDLDRTRQLAPRVPHGVTVISESGINTYGQIRELSRFANGFLIGSALMSEPDLSAAVRRVTLGDNKVCGLTRPQDASVAHQAGAIYGGLIFVEASPRYVTLDKALDVQAGAPLKYVGVFRDHAPDSVADIAKNLQLAAVQLHGSEDQSYIDSLRPLLPAECQIWKALSVKETMPARELNQVDRYVLDNGKGGTGQRFDWSKLAGQDLSNVLLAGGLGADNCVEAAQLGCAGLDFNSGVEREPGIKDADKITAVFQTLRAY